MAVDAALRIPMRPGTVFGAGAAAELPALVAELGATSALVVTDAGLVGAGVAGRVADRLRAAGVRTEVFDAVEANPTTATVHAGAQALEEFGPAAVIGLGGGSPIDAAKAVVARAAGATARIIAVPTTAGTGTETNAFGVIEDPATRRKVYLGSAATMPRFAVLDPELTVSAPPGVTAACGLDVLAHAIESLQARTGNAYSAALALEAVRMVCAHLPAVVADGHDLEGRAELLLAAHLAALAFATTGLGTAHAIGHAVSARYGAPHGVALAAVLAPVAARNAVERPDQTARAALAAGGGDLPAAVGELQDRVGLRPRLRELGVPHDELGDVAADALADEVIRGAPRIPSHAELSELLAAAY